MEDESASITGSSQPRYARRINPTCESAGFGLLANESQVKPNHALHHSINHLSGGGSTHTGPTPFGGDLAEVLRQQCQGRLSPINWFRTDWQRGGALTGYASFTTEEGVDQPVVVKLPVPPCERLWLVRLQRAGRTQTAAPATTQHDMNPVHGPNHQNSGSDRHHGQVVPRVYAHGQTLGGYDLAWVVMERMPHGPLGQALNGPTVDLLIETLGRFYRHARQHPIEREPTDRDWPAMLRDARRRVREGGVPDTQRWKAALKKASRRMDRWLTLWHGRARHDLVHGDFHPANAMTRMEPPAGPAVLLDLAQVRPGHWVEDAVYLEHLYWAYPQALHDRRVCSALAKARKAYDLPVDEHWPQLAAVKRTLLAMSAPVFAHHEAGPAHLHAALHVLEREVG